MDLKFLDFEQPIAELEAKIEELRFVGDDSEVNINEEVARLRSSTTKNVDAYLVYQKGVDVFFTFTREAMVETRQLMNQALELDPEFASAIILIAWTRVTEAEYGYTDSRDEAIALARQELARLDSLGLNDTVLARGEALMIRGYLEMLHEDIDKAVEYGEQSINLLPNHPDMTAILGLPAGPMDGDAELLPSLLLPPPAPADATRP